MTKHQAIRLTSTAIATLILLAAAALYTAAQEPRGPTRACPGPSAGRRRGSAAMFRSISRRSSPHLRRRRTPHPCTWTPSSSSAARWRRAFRPVRRLRPEHKKSLERSERLRPLLEAFRRDPASVDRAEMAAVIASYEAGFQKLDQAQKRPRCVFENGLDFASPAAPCSVEPPCGQRRVPAHAGQPRPR